jgi:hypothetical protein
MHAPVTAPSIDTSLSTDALMAARMRLVLSISALLAVAVDAGQSRQPVASAVWLVFSGYILHSLLVYASTRMGWRYVQGKAVHWSDVLWFTLIVFVTDGVQSLFFLFYFFAILTSSFRWGFEEGARVTVVSVASFAVCGLGTSSGDDAPQLLMRTTFLLALGHMIVHWGGSKLVAAAAPCPPERHQPAVESALRRGPHHRPHDGEDAGLFQGQPLHPHDAGQRDRHLDPAHTAQGRRLRTRQRADARNIAESPLMALDHRAHRT